MTTQSLSRTTRSVRIGPWAPGDARHFVRRELELDGGDSHWGKEILDDAELLVSEIITVATLQSGSDEATVAVKADDGHVRVEVSDAHRGFSMKRQGDGFGMAIVDLIAPKWGVDLSKPGKTVWFELESIVT